MANLSELIECGRANAQTQANAAMDAFGPLARLICEVRFMIATIPQARAISYLIGIPDPGELVDLSAAISVVTVARDVVQVAVTAVTILGAAFGLQLPSATFTCPPQSAPLPEEDVPMPVVTQLTDLNGLDLLSIPLAASSSEPDFVFRVIGTDFREDSQIMFGAETISEDKAVFDSGFGWFTVYLPASLRLFADTYGVSVVNQPSGGLFPFDGLGGSSDNDLKVSDPFDIAVA